MGGQLGIGGFLLAGGGTGLAPDGYGWALLRMLAALALVCVLAVVLLRWIAQRGSTGQQGQRLLRVIERCPLSSRQSLWLVEVRGRYLLLGASDSNVNLLAELDSTTISRQRGQGDGRPGDDLFRKILRRGELGPQGEAAQPLHPRAEGAETEPAPQAKAAAGRARVAEEERSAAAEERR